MKVVFENSSTGIYFNCSSNEIQQDNNECVVNILSFYPFFKAILVPREFNFESIDCVNSI